MTERPAFRAASLLQALHEADVRFVVIGGIAAQAQGSPVMTEDLDVCHATDRDNLERLAGVLRDLAAVRRGMPDGISAPLDARALRAAAVLTLTTRHGDLDLLSAPEPGLDYEKLVSNAERFAIDGMELLVASVDDLIAMKSFANRPKDQAALHHLGALRQVIDQQR